MRIACGHLRTIELLLKSSDFRNHKFQPLVRPTIWFSFSEGQTINDCNVAILTIFIFLEYIFDIRHLLLVLCIFVANAGLINDWTRINLFN